MSEPCYQFAHITGVWHIRLTRSNQG